jgi:Pectate lyase superfamily protein
MTSINSGTELSLLSRSTYVVSSPIIAYYYTQIIGDAKKPPTLLASSKFGGIAVIGMPFFILSDLQHLIIFW